MDFYPKLVKSKREELGLSQNELSIKLNEKESVISKIENGSLKPSLDLAKKLGKFLGLDLVVSEKAVISDLKHSDSRLTVGDFLQR